MSINVKITFASFIAFLIEFANFPLFTLPPPYIRSKTLMLKGGLLEISSATYDSQALLDKSRSGIIKASWIPFFPALAITYTIFTFNLFEEGFGKGLI
jgi:hypothetical protein